MPRIPTSQRTVQEGRFRAPGVSAKAARLSQVDIAGGLSNIVDKAGSLYLKEREKADKIEVDGFERRSREKFNELVHDKDRGFYNVRGKNTTLKIDDYNKEFNDFMESETSSLGSDRLREKVKRVSGLYKLDLDTTMNRHTGREMRKYEDSEFQANLKSVQNHAAMNYQDYGVYASRVEESITKQNELIGSFGKNRGMSEKQIGLLKLNASSSLHENVITQALNNNEDQLAKQYYALAKEKEQIDGETSKRLDRILNASSIKGESQRISDEIIAKDLNLEDSLTEARNISDPDLRDQSVARVKRRYNEKKVALKEADKENFNSIINELNSFKSIDHLPESQKLLMSKKKKEITNKLLDMISRGHEPKTHPQIYQDLMVKAASPVLRQQFLDLDVNEFAHKLSNTDRKKFLTMQSDIRSGKGQKHEDEFGRFLSHNQIIKNTIAEFNVPKGSVGEFSQMVADQAIVWQKANQKKAIPNDELMKISESLAVQIDVGGKFFDKPVYKLKPDEEIIGVDFDDISIKNQGLLRDAFRSNGMEFTEEAAEKYYLKYIQGILK